LIQYTQVLYTKVSRFHWLTVTMKNVWICKLRFPILKIFSGKWTKERVILVTYLVCKSILPIRLVWGITSKLTFLRKLSLHPPKKVNPNKFSKKKNIVHPKPNAKTCHYCMNKRHTSYKCYVRIFDFPRGKYAWIPKDLIVKINPIEPNLNWVPPLSNWFCLVGVPKSKRLTMVLG